MTAAIRALLLSATTIRPAPAATANQNAYACSSPRSRGTTASRARSSGDSTRRTYPLDSRLSRDSAPRASAGARRAAQSAAAAGEPYGLVAVAALLGRPDLLAGDHVASWLLDDA